MVIAEDTKTIRNYLPSQLAIEAAIEAAIAAADPERFRGPVSSARRFRKSCEEASFRFYSAAPWPDRERKRDRREKKKGRKKAWPKERGRDERGPKEHTALGARKKAILGGRRRRSRTGRVISRWNLVKQSSLLNDDDDNDDEDVARGLPGCLIKIEVVRCSPHPPSSHTFVLRR